MDFKFVLPFISIDIKELTKFEVNWTQIDNFSLRKLKTTKMAIISQNPICPSVNHQKAYPSYILQKVSESM